MAKKKERTVTQQVDRTSFTRTVKEVEKACSVCDKRFWGAESSRYCSRACQNKANYERHAEAYRKKRLQTYYQQKATDK